MSTGLRRAIALVVAIAVIWPAAASATSDHDATAHTHFLVQQRAERGLVLGKKTVSVGVDLLSSSGAFSGYAGLLPLRAGVHNKVDVFLTPQWQNNGGGLKMTQLGGRYRLRDGLLEMAAQASVGFALGDGEAGSITGSAPMRMHFRENLSLDASPSLTVLTTPVADWYLSLPLGANFNVTDAVAIIGETSLSLQEGAAGFGGMTIGISYTAGSPNKPWLELGGRMRWTSLGNQGLMQAIFFARYYGHLK